MSNTTPGGRRTTHKRASFLHCIPRHTSLQDETIRQPRTSVFQQIDSSTSFCGPITTFGSPPYGRSTKEVMQESWIEKVLQHLSIYAHASISTMLYDCQMTQSRLMSTVFVETPRMMGFEMLLNYILSTSNQRQIEGQRGEVEYLQFFPEGMKGTSQSFLYHDVAAVTVVLIRWEQFRKQDRNMTNSTRLKQLLRKGVPNQLRCVWKMCSSRGKWTPMSEPKSGQHVWGVGSWEIDILIDTKNTCLLNLSQAKHCIKSIWTFDVHFHPTN